MQTDNLQESEAEITTAQALVSIITKEKEDIIEVCFVHVVSKFE